MLLEIIATTLSEAKDAQAYGASRIELISAPKEGGLTPTYAMVEAVKAVLQIPVHVMVRSHNKGYIYDEGDQMVMIEDAKMMNQLGVDRFVFGCLNHQNEIDEVFLKRFCEAVAPTPITFHRAIDEVTSIETEVAKLKNYPQVVAVLSAYGHQPAPQNSVPLKALHHQLKQMNKTLLVGGGLAIDTMASFLEATGVEEVHLGTGVRIKYDFYQPISKKSMEKLVTILEAHNI